MNKGLVARPDGAQIAYTHYKGQGTPLCFVPGLGGTQLGFEGDARHFASRGHSVVTVDLRGLGDSQPPALAVENFTLGHMAADVVAVLQHLQIGSAHVLGNSLGGVIGLEMVRSFPEYVRSLTTFGTTYHLDKPRHLATVQNVTFALVGRKRLPGFVAKTGTTVDAARPVIRAMFEAFEPEVGKCMRLNIYQYDYRGEAANWQGPILMIRGELDRTINSELATTLEAVASNPRFTRVDLEGAGHFTNLDAPEAFREAVAAFIEESKGV